MKRTVKCLAAVLAALLLAAAALGAVRITAEHAVPAYPASFGNLSADEKITGESLLEAASENADTLFVFGSSELKTTDICTHPANFFAGRRAGFQVDLIGRGSCQSIIHAMCIAASGDALTGKQIVLITAPQSYVEDGIAPDLFMANFSEQKALSIFADETIPQPIKQYLASRIAKISEKYRENTSTRAQLDTAAGCMSRAIASENSLAQTLLTPYAAMSKWMLDTKDFVEAAKVLRAYEPAETEPKPKPIDWEAEEANALLQAEQMVTGNDYFMQDDYYNTYIGLRLPQQKGKDQNISYETSPEYDDLRCLLELCRIKGIEALFVHVPMHGSWSDYTGFDAEKRADYYEKVRQITEEYDNITLLDLTTYEYEPYFLCDTMHLGWKGWLAVDKAMVEFYKAD